MRKILSALLICCSFLLFISCKAADPDASVNPSASETASDEAEVLHFIQPGYSSKQLHTVWDMKIYNGCLYIGAGDFDKNISPGVARRYRLSENIWESCGAIHDEQIGRFVVIDGKSMIPGFDPTEDWTLGNYYSLDGDVFTKHRSLPGGIHCFDLAKNDDGFFAALGVSSGNMPVVSAKTGDEQFGFVPFTDADGSPLSTQPYTEVRVYDMVHSNRRH